MAEEGNAPVTEEGEGGSLVNAEIELGENEVWLAEGIKGEKPEWFKGDKYKTVAEQAKAYTELEKKFGAFKGAPESYEIPEIEGVEIPSDDPLVETYTEWAKSKNMDQESFAEGLEMLTSYVQQSDSIDRQAEIEKLGPQASQMIQQAGRFLENHFEGDELKRAQDALTTADSVWLVNKMIGATAPQKLPSEGGHNPDGLTAESLREMSMKKNEAGQLLRSVDPEYNKKVQAMYDKFYGDQPQQQFVG